MNQFMIDALASLLWAIPNRTPGKGRLGRLLLAPFEGHSPALIRDRAGNSFLAPSYAEPIIQDIFTFGAYEAGIQKAILAHLPETGTFVDVGANIGTITVPIARARPDARLLSIEADPAIYRVLQENVARNGRTNVQTVCCVAGSADSAAVPFYRAPEDKFGMGSIGPQFDAEPITLTQRALDTVLAALNIAQVDVVKIDVEGAEARVLRGAPRLLSQGRPPVVILEFADWSEARISGQKPGDAQRELFACGYRLFHLDDEGRQRNELFAPMTSGYSMILALPPHLQGAGPRAASRAL